MTIAALRWIKTARAKRGVAPLHKDYLEPGTLLESALRQVLAEHGPRQLDVELRAGQTRKLMGDSERLLQALTCVLDNAVVHSEDGGHLWLRCEDFEQGDRPYVAIHVGNSGSYIPRDQRRRIFLGLDLAVVQRIVEAHGGWTTVRSSPEIGTEFVLTLPAALAPSRYQPLCLKVSLATLAVALTGTLGGQLGFA